MLSGEGRDEGTGWRDSGGEIESLVLSGCGKEEGVLGQQTADVL